MKTLFLLAFLVRPACAVDLQTIYFSAGWAKTTNEAPPAPAAKPSQPTQKPVGDLHNPVAHMDITVKAYQIYAARFGGGELAQFIGTVDGENPAAEDDGNVVAGSYDEDKSFKNPFNEMLPMERHFWDIRGGLHAGWQGHDSSVNRAHKYWSGGYGVEGDFDSDWEKKGVKDEGVIGAYKKGDKAKAYWYLGHVAHLVEDLCVPAHALLFTHVGEGTDMYETYMKHHFGEWSPAANSPVDSYDSLLDLFSKTAVVTNQFDAGHGPGDEGVDGEKDRGARRAGGFTEDQLKEEGRTLMPLAYNRVASLFLFFFKQIDKQPPKVTLLMPASLGNEITLDAAATDTQSGVDRQGFRFEVLEAGRWTAISSARFVGVPGRSYSFRVWARDAVGNTAVSKTKTWRAGSPAVASR
jgi:hypothetical protein